MSSGWICPRCGRGLAPWVSECPCYYENMTVTTSSNTVATNNLGGRKCDKVCGNKTDYGYCRTTVCIRPEFGGDPDYGIGNGA